MAFRKVLSNERPRNYGQFLKTEGENIKDFKENDFSHIL